MKQVPTCEYFPEQAIATNCLGAGNIVQALRDHDYPVEAVSASAPTRPASRSTPWA